jgi:hypothetical protein
MKQMTRKIWTLLLAISSFAIAQTREKRIVPVDSGLRQSFERQPKIAVLAGIGTYPSRSGLSRLRYPAHDVELLQSVLTHQGYKVVALKEQEATKTSIEQALKDAAELVDRGSGTVLFFFSGHGFADQGQNYLAAFEASSANLAGSGLAVKDVEALLKASGAPRQVMFLDACRNEPGKSAGVRSFERFEASAGLRELLSTKAGRISYEDDHLGSGIFTHFLVEGLQGEAAGQHGLITFHDLAEYVTDAVSTYGFQHGEMQVPYEAGESSGDFLLGRAAAATVSAPVSSHPAPVAVTAPVSVSLPSASTGAAHIGNVDISQFAGLTSRDTKEKVISLFGKPKQYNSTLMYGSLLMIQRGMPGTGRRGNPVTPAGEIEITLATDGEHIAMVAVRSEGQKRAEKKGTSPLLQLLGKAESEATSLLGAANEQATTETGLEKWIWKSSDSTASLELHFSKGNCTSITVRW